MSIKVREQVKSLLGESGVTMKQVAQCLSEKMNKKYSLANLSSKLKRGTLTYNEFLEILEILDYEISIRPKNIN